MNGMDPERARATLSLDSSRRRARRLGPTRATTSIGSRARGRTRRASADAKCRRRSRMNEFARDIHELHMSEDVRQSRIYVRFRRYSTHTRDVRTRDTVHGLLYLSTTNTRPSRDHTRAYETKPKDPIGIGPDRAATSLDRSTTLDANDGQGPRETARGDVLPLPHAHRGDARAV